MNISARQNNLARKNSYYLFFATLSDHVRVPVARQGQGRRRRRQRWVEKARPAYNAVDKEIQVWLHCISSFEAYF